MCNQSQLSLKHFTRSGCVFSCQLTFGVLSFYSSQRKGHSKAKGAETLNTHSYLMRLHCPYKKRVSVAKDCGWKQPARQLTCASRAEVSQLCRVCPALSATSSSLSGRRVANESWPWSCRPAMNTQPTHRVRLAEWSKAPDLSSGSRERAWVRTPHLTIQSFDGIFRLSCVPILTDFSFEGGAGVCSFGTPL